MHVTIECSYTTERGRYLNDCARIRDVSITHLIRILIEKIAEDRLTEAVLDDDSQPHARTKHTHRYRRHRKHIDREHLT